MQEVKSNAKQSNVDDEAIVMEVHRKISALDRLINQWNRDNRFYPIQLSYPPFLANFVNRTYRAERDMAKAIAGINKWITQFQILKLGTEVVNFPPGLQYEGLSLVNMEGVAVELPNDEKRRKWMEHIQKGTESEGREYDSLEMYQRDMLDLIIITDIARSSLLIMREDTGTAIDENLWTHQDYDWVRTGVGRNNQQPLEPKYKVRREELMKILHVILSNKPDPVYHTQLMDGLEQRHVLKPDNLASRKAYQKLEEGDEWNGHLNPRAPIHKDTNKNRTEEDDDVLCLEMDLVNRGSNVYEGREHGNEMEQKVRLRASPSTPKTQRMSSNEHRADNTAQETKDINKRFKHSTEQHVDERTTKGKHRKSRMDGLAITSKDCNLWTFSPARKVNRDDLLLKKDKGRTDPYLHTKRVGYENKRKEYTPPRLSPKHRSSAKSTTKVNSERHSVTKRDSECLPKRKDDWIAEKVSDDDLRIEMNKKKKDREERWRREEGKGKDTEARASISNETRTIRERHSSVENKSKERPQIDESGPLGKSTPRRTPDWVHSEGKREEEIRKSQPPRPTRSTPDKGSPVDGNSSGFRVERLSFKKHGSSTERNRSGDRSRQRSGQTPREERSSNRRSRMASEEKANRVQKCYSVTPGTPFQDALHIRQAPIVVDAGIKLKKILVAQSYSDVHLEREMTKLSACRNKWCHCRKSERK
ncbi:MAG: hypothetical protein GY696_35100 [Gammaproteobacteria bacterium]|nr:hypothetical protein [Gammaproteobacteria bacterium]